MGPPQSLRTSDGIAPEIGGFAGSPACKAVHCSIFWHMQLIVWSICYSLLVNKQKLLAAHGIMDEGDVLPVLDGELLEAGLEQRKLRLHVLQFDRLHMLPQALVLVLYSNAIVW